MWGWKHPDLPSVLYPNAQLEPNLVLHVCSTSHAQEISMHCLKKKTTPKTKHQTTVHSLSYYQQIIILLLSCALLNLLMFCWL